MGAAAAEGEQSAKTALRTEKEKGVPYLSSVIREDIAVTVDVPPKLPPPQPFVGVAIAGLSRDSLDAEHMGEHPPPAHGQYDIV